MKPVAFVRPFGRARKSLLPLLLLLTLPAVAQAQFIFKTNNGTLSITSYIGPGGAVTIPGTTNGLPVTAIGEQAFLGCNGLTNVTIGTNVTSIASDAFSGCSSLTAIWVDTHNSVYSDEDGVLLNQSQTILLTYPSGRAGGYTIPNSVTNIADEAFAGCINLTNITIPNSVTSIGDNAFDTCSSLTSVTSPDSVTSIGFWGFGYCINLTSVTLPNSVTNLGAYAFGYCFSLTTAAIPNGVTSMDGTFQECHSLTNVTIPNSVTSIGSGAFEECYRLTSVTLPNSLTNIGEFVFRSCANLTSIIIPSSVTNIWSYAFLQCALTSVYFQGNAPSVGTGAFTGDGNVTGYYLPGTTGWESFSTNANIPIVLWDPQVQTSSATFGVLTNGFGFTITGSSNLVIVVEASINLANPAWSAVSTNTLAGGSSYFSDPQWTNYPARFYRLRSP